MIDKVDEKIKELQELSDDYAIRFAKTRNEKHKRSFDTIEFAIKALNDVLNSINH